MIKVLISFFLLLSSPSILCSNPENFSIEIPDVPENYFENSPVFPSPKRMRYDPNALEYSDENEEITIDYSSDPLMNAEKNENCMEFGENFEEKNLNSINYLCDMVENQEDKENVKSETPCSSPQNLFDGYMNFSYPSNPEYIEEINEKNIPREFPSKYHYISSNTFTLLHHGNIYSIDDIDVFRKSPKNVDE